MASPRNDPAIIEKALESDRREVAEGGHPVAKWVPVVQREERAFEGDREVVTRRSKSGQLEVLVLFDTYNVKGDYIRQAKEDIDDKAQPCVAFRFNDEGSQLFAGLTSENLPQEGHHRKLGIILDGELKSAPRIITTISERGEITRAVSRTKRCRTFARFSTPAACPPP